MLRNFIFNALMIAVLASCRSTPPTPPSSVSAEVGPKSEVYSFVYPPELIGGSGIHLGGFSALTFEGRDAKGRLVFQTTTDRGPNRDIKILASTGSKVRPFALPDFQPEWVRFYLDSDHKAVIIERRPLVSGAGKPLSGRPNLLGENGDETPVSDADQALALDPMGLDLEGMALDADGTYWMGEEYRPSILHFDAKGRMLSRWIPETNSLKYGLPVLPKHLKFRVPNRGFEGIANDNQFIYAFMQGALKGENAFSRILKVSKKMGRPLAEYAYLFETAPAGWPASERIGDAVAIGPGRFLVIEQNSAIDEHAIRRVYEVDISAADDLLRAQASKILSDSSFCSVKATKPCVAPVRKSLVVDLAEAGMRHLEKAEGIAVVDASTLAVINDNDFGVGQYPDAKSEVHLIRLSKPLPLSLSH